MRIVAGLHRGRALAAPPGRDLRPTSDRARQAVFDILMHADWDGFELEGARVLDAFCGTGALALEALSRGAAHATLMDQSSESLAAARQNVAALRETERTTVLRADAARPPRAPAPVDLLFLDPPYGKGLAEPALAALAAAGWLREGTVAMVEVAARDPFAPPPGFAPLDERRYGAARVVFLRREGT